MPVYSTIHQRIPHSPVHNSKQPKKSKNRFHRNETCLPTDTATRRHFPHTNKFRLTMQQSDKRHWSLEPLQRRRITPNSAETTRKCAYWTKHRERLHDSYTGNKTNDQDFHQPYWKSSQIELCQTPTNKIKQISKIIFFMKISSNTSQEYFNIQPRTKRHTRHKILKVNPQPRFRTPISSLNNKCVFIYSCRKVRWITYKLKSISRRYEIIILIQSIIHILLKDKTQLIMTPTKKIEPTTTIR